MTSAPIAARRKLTVKRDGFSETVGRLCDRHSAMPYRVDDFGRGIFHLAPVPIAAGIHSRENYQAISREAWMLFDRKLDLIYTDEPAYYRWLQELFDDKEEDHVLEQVRAIHTQCLLSGPTLCKISLLFSSKLDRMLGDLVDPNDFAQDSSVLCAPTILLDAIASRIREDVVGCLEADASPTDLAFVFADFCSGPSEAMQAMHECSVIQAAWRADARGHLRKALAVQAAADENRARADAAAAALIAEEEEEEQKENIDPNKTRKAKKKKSFAPKKQAKEPSSRQVLAEANARRLEGRAELARITRERESAAARRRMLKEMTADAAKVAVAIREIESVIIEDAVDPDLCGACFRNPASKMATCWPCGHESLCDACAIAAWTAGISCPARCPRCCDRLSCVTLGNRRRLGF